MEEKRSYLFLFFFLKKTKNFDLVYLKKKVIEFIFASFSLLSSVDFIFGEKIILKKLFS